MAITSNSYTGNGSTTLYSFTFPYLDESHVKVSLNGTLTTAYTFANATTIQFNTAPGVGVAILIYRQTDDSALEATFFAGSSIKAQDLNENFLQSIYINQEVNNRALDSNGDTMSGILNMGGYKITNLGTPTASTDATTKAYVDATVNAGVGDGDKGDITVSGTGTVFAIDSGVVTETKLATDSVSNAKILNGAVTPSKISTNGPSWEVTGNLSVPGTGYVDLPAGTTAERPGTPNSGMVRYNTSLGYFEGYGTSWGKIGGGATGGGSDDVFYENGQTVTTNYTLTTGKNAMSAGTITIANGVTVTIPANQSWSIV